LATVGTIDFDGHFLLNTLTRFVRDTSASIRRLVATFFHEICGLLTSQQCVTCLLGIFGNILQDTDLTVRHHVVQHLDKILRSFNIEDVEARKLHYQDLLPAIAACSKDGATNWRAQSTLVRHFAEFPKYFNHTTLVRLFVPQLLKMMEGASPTIQHGACRALAIFGRDCVETRCHEEMMRRYDNQYSCAESFSRRKIYLIACEEMLQTHSMRFGRERVMLTVVTLFDDLVLDIRRKALMLIPLLWNILLTTKEDKAIRKNLLERLDIEASDKKSGLVAQTAVHLKLMVTECMQLGNSDQRDDAIPTTMNDSIAQKQRDHLLEEQEISFGAYNTQEMSDSRQQVLGRLVASNKALRKAHSKGVVSVSSDEDDTSSLVKTILQKKKNNTMKSGAKVGGNTRKKSNSKPAPLPRHGALPDIMNNKAAEKGGDNNAMTSIVAAREAEVMTMVSSSGSGSGRSKPKRRGPPGKGKNGPRSPRAGKGIIRR
jgi:hypothetical protein